MSANLILTTSDTQLAADWSAQLPSPGGVSLGAEALRRELSQIGARVWVKDIADPRSRLVPHPDTVVIVVGQPQSTPFEQARFAGDGRFFLSYAESREQLRDAVRTATELTEKNAIIRTLQSRDSRPPLPLPREPVPVGPTAADDLNFVESAIEHLEDRTRVLEEFRRAAQNHLRSPRVSLFLRSATGFQSDRHGWTALPDTLLTQRMEDFPCVIDLDDWTGMADPASESFIRQQMQSWGARLLVPLYELGRLSGWVAYGPRADGRPYDATDRTRALQLGRLLERCLEKADRIRTLAESASEESLRRKYLPSVRILGREASSDVTLPPEIRALAGEVLRTGRLARLEPGPTVRFRAEAGPIPETNGLWVRWEEAEAELSERAATAETERLKLCRELGLTLSHELGGPLVTLTTFLQLCQQQGASPELLEEFNGQLDRDAGKLRDLARTLHLMQEFMVGSVSRLDLGDLVGRLSLRGAMRIEPNEMAPAINGNEAMLLFAFQTIFDAVARNRTEADGGITIAVKRRGEGEAEIGLVLISGRKLHLEGFIEAADGAVPVHPLLGVFLAREIIHWHNGTFQGGQGLTGSEIQIAIRSRVPAGVAFDPTAELRRSGSVVIRSPQSSVSS